MKTIPSFIFIFLAVVNVADLSAQEKISGAPTKRISESIKFNEVTISPNGKLIAYVGRTKAQLKEDRIHFMDLDGNLIHSKNDETDRLAGSKIQPGSQRSLAWSPDSKMVAFLAAGSDGAQAVYLISSIDHSVKKIIPLKGFAEKLQWSPDGTQLAMLFTENALRAAGPTEAAARETGIIEETAYVHRITVLNMASRQLRQVSPPDQYVHEFIWSPDGKSFAAISAPPPGDNNWYASDLNKVNAASGEITKLLSPGMQIGVPRWSPDGKQLAFIGGLMSDEPIPTGDLYVIPATGGQPKNLTGTQSISATSIRWEPDSQNILVHAIDSGSTTVATINSLTGQYNRIWHEPAQLAANSLEKISVASDGQTSALVKHSFYDAPEIWTGPIGKWRPATALNTLVAKNVGRAKSIRWKSDSLVIQGWLVYPQSYDSTRSYPMIVSVHGGPAYVAMPRWEDPNSLLSLLSASGYFVFLPNFRGSSGCGESFTRANVKDLGYGDLRDILNGVDHIVAQYRVDSKRVGIIGWSYGGFMTMWAVTQTNRFRAAVAGAGIANWQSYFGQNGITRWCEPYFGGSVLDIPEIYAKSSPINYIRQVKTPTLIAVGERDLECPPPQSYEFWRGLQHFGVKTKLIIYPDAGHALRPDQQQDYFRQSVAWFKEMMK